MDDYTSTEPLIEEQAAARAQGFMRDGWLFLGLAALITILRTYSRWSMVGWKRFQADDVLVWLALGLYAATTEIDVQLIGKYKGLANDFTDDGLRDAISSSSREYRLRVGASKLRLIEWPLYALLLWSLKAAMAVFYMRLMETLEGYRRRIYIFFGLLVTMFGVVVTVPFVVCTPIQKMWQITPDPGPLCYPESSPAILWTVLACNTITDAYLLWLPVPMLFHASLPRGTKIVLTCLFGCGLFVTIAATLRITLVATEVHDFHAIGFWSVRETFVAIVTTNLPAIFVLLRRWFKSTFRAFEAHSHDKSRNSTTHHSSTSKSRFTHWWSSPPPHRPAEKLARLSPNGTLLSRSSSSRRKASRASAGTLPHSIKTKRGGSAASDRQRMLSPMPSVQEALWNSRRRSANSVEQPRPSAQRKGSSGRGLNERVPTPASGIRKQVDIMIVEEALHELGHANPRLDRFDFENQKDTKRLPDLPDVVYKW